MIKGSTGGASTNMLQACLSIGRVMSQEARGCLSLKQLLVIPFSGHSSSSASHQRLPASPLL